MFMEEKQICVEMEIVLKEDYYNKEAEAYIITHMGDTVHIPYKTIRIHALSEYELHDYYDLNQVEKITVKLGKMYRVPSEAELKYLNTLKDGE